MKTKGYDIKKIPKTNLNYVELYSKELKENPKLFSQQKMLINSQIKASNSLFKNFGKGEEFKQNARESLKGIKLI
ncbi:MAG: hypothetical protein KJ949_03180 [Nanoarchaeota archaeon]|nr:hypothetical protein [Nanoarchaeota archaeon]MBU4308178.1 hypothetical protein [Nanoarchaeota archaeon]